jgi:hypothetical protein
MTAGRIPLAELKRRHIEAGGKLAQPPAAQAPHRISGGTFITLSALKQMLAWSLLCHGIIGKNDDFDVTLRGDGVVVRTLRGK